MRDQIGVPMGVGGEGGMMGFLTITSSHTAPET